MLARLLSRVMDWAIARNGGGAYEGEDSKKWAYTIRAPDGSPYLSRILLPRVTIPLVGQFRPMLHHFHQADDDTLHSHPWSWAVSFILAGAYDEERLTGDSDVDRYMTAEGWCQLCGKWRGTCTGHAPEVDHKLVRWFNKLTGADYHRVTKLRGDVWTLFVAGERKPDDAWGFLDERGKHVPWQEFLAERDSRKKAVRVTIPPLVQEHDVTESVLLQAVPYGQHATEWNLPPDWGGADMAPELMWQVIQYLGGDNLDRCVASYEMLRVPDETDRALQDRWKAEHLPQESQ